MEGIGGLPPCDIAQEAAAQAGSPGDVEAAGTFCANSNGLEAAVAGRRRRLVRAISGASLTGGGDDGGYVAWSVDNWRLDGRRKKRRGRIAAVAIKRNARALHDTMILNKSGKPNLPSSSKGILYIVSRYGKLAFST